jgi:hypothetical protein
LVSLDIDGTLEGGDPSGPIPLEFARRLQSLGVLVGSSSDRTLTDQRRFWQAGGVEVDFIVLKHQLPELPGKYACGRYLHIGDTNQDMYFARLAGFEFWHVDSLERPAPGEQAAQAMIELLLLRLSGDGQAG